MKRLPLGSREAEIIRRLKYVIKLPVTKIATAVARNKTSVYKALKRSFKPLKRGRPNTLHKKDITLLARTIKAMVKKAKARYQVTMAMAMRRCKIKAMARPKRRLATVFKVFSFSFLFSLSVSFGPHRSL